MYFKLLIGMLIGCNAISAFAGSDGTRGGGQTIDLKGRPVLRDLYDNTSCIWENAYDFGRELPQYRKILALIRERHWYAAFTYERETKNLKVCKSNAPLVSIPAEDRDSVTIVRYQTSQAAIRLNDRIYIDFNIFNKMNEVDQGYLFVHEITHSFIPMNTH